MADRCGASSSASHGLLDFFFSGCLVFSIVMPLMPEPPIETGVNVLGAGVGSRLAGLLPSPILTSASTARSRLPFVLLSTSEFLLLSSKPMSLSVASFASKLLPTLVIFIPNIWLGLFDFCGLAGSSPLLPDRSLPVYAGDSGGVYRSGLLLRWKGVLALRMKPNFLLGLGGREGGSSLQLPVPVLPVFCLSAGCAPLPSPNPRDSYFCRMNFSIAPSTSSASTGMSARTPLGL